jgi:hypothetical protein
MTRDSVGTGIDVIIAANAKEERRDHVWTGQPLTAEYGVTALPFSFLLPSDQKYGIVIPFFLTFANAMKKD